MKTVFVAMNAEFIHPGHINIIKVARELGEVTVGLATDRLNARYKRVAVMNFEQRKMIVENIKGVKQVIPQDTLDMAPILRKLKPDYFVHGDDWKTGRLMPVRRQVAEIIKEWGGQLVEPPYTPGISSTILNDVWWSTSPSPDFRRNRLSQLMESQAYLRFLMVSTAQTGSTAGQSPVNLINHPGEYDVLWLTQIIQDLTIESQEDTDSGFRSSILTINDILDGTEKPLVVEWRPRGGEQDFAYRIRTLERMGVSAICIDCESCKDEGLQSSDRKKAKIISSGKKSKTTDEFKIIVRINLPRKKRLFNETRRRAQSYIDAGVDALLISRWSEKGGTALELIRIIRELDLFTPIFLEVSGRTDLTDGNLADSDIQGVVYYEE